MLRNYLMIVAALLLLAVAGSGTVAAQTADEDEVTWLARYWNNIDRSGAPALVRGESAIDHDWGSGSPDPAIAADRFSAQWTADVEFAAGTYRFSVTSDDGMRVWLDGELIVDSWTARAEQTDTVTRALAAGTYGITVDYFENTGVAVARFSWERLDEPGDGTCGASYTVQPGDWLHRIARLCDTSAAALLAANPGLSDGTLIYPGQVLLIPAPGLDAAVTIIPERGPAGTDIQVAAVGFPANAEVRAAIGRAQSEPVTSVTTTSDAEGTVSATITVPEGARAGESWVVLVTSDTQRALSGSFTVTPDGVAVTATTVPNLNFRPQPSLSTTPIGVVPAGTTVPVLGRDQAGDWLLVSYGGERGWIAGWLTSIDGCLADVPVATERGQFPRAAEAITINAPGPGSRVTSPLRVAGSADPAQHQEIEVRLLLEDGSTLAETTATIDAPLGQRGPYEVELPFTISGERQAFLQVLSRSARDGGITSLNAVGLTVAAAGPEEIRTVAATPARVTIYEPAPLQTVSGGVATVNGFGFASFEQTLVVEVLDAAGNVAGSEPVMVDSVALGEPGPFSVDVAYHASSAGPGRIVVRDPSPAFGGDVYVTSVEITLAP
jgi:LysM repeat protein